MIQIMKGFFKHYVFLLMTLAFDGCDKCAVFNSPFH